MVKVRKPRTDGLRAALLQLAQAEATLVANQAAFVAQISQTSRETAELRRESAERIQHIESILLQLIEVLPEAVRERIGIQKK
jgi:hypothetical protein